MKIMIAGPFDDQAAVRCVDSIIDQAIHAAASDIHIEWLPDCLRLRYRIDGVLCTVATIPSTVAPQVVARLKVLAHINIAERWVPHDGKFTVMHKNRAIDLRVSTFPALYGENVVIRILDRNAHALDLDELGFAPQMAQQFRQLMLRPSGFFLVTGPTGSGKTTTLYAVLSVLNSPDKNIITLEDPVEYQLNGITQGQIRPEVGFTFERGLRSLLRQDPDIAMVGEIRDKQTARIAIEAALTGHLVLSTLHTNDAPGAIMRLMDMDVEPFLINAAITGVLAQRLARTICQKCRIETTPTADEQAWLAHMNCSVTTVYQGQGCAACLQMGYKGRIGIFELLVMTNELRSLIIHQPVFDDIYEQALTDGMQTLLQDGMHKVHAGLITLQELMRIIG
jgi:general secretion pathway protein E